MKNDRPAMQPGFLRKADAARYMGISVRTLSDWMLKHVVPYHKLGHRTVIFSVDDLTVALRRFRIAAVGE